MEILKTYEEESEVLPLILLLEEYRIPYEQEEKRLLIPPKERKRFEQLLMEEKARKQEWDTYGRYDSKVILENMTQLLEHHNIPHKISQNQAFVEAYLDNPMLQHYTIQLQLKDFDRVNELLREQALQQSIYLDQDYHLRGLSDEELLEILENQDEWHIVDVEGARYLLDERGQHYSQKDVELMRLRRMIELRRPKEANTQDLILAYFFTISTGILGLFWGWHYTQDKTVLPNGRKVPTFAAQTRKHGQRLLWIGSFISLSVLVYLILSGVILQLLNW